MKRVLLGLVWLLFAIQVNGQYVLSGKIIDEQHVPLEGASIIVEELMTGSIADAGGNFSLSDLPSGGGGLWH